MPLEQSDANVKTQLEMYVRWASEDVRVAGFNPWHWSDRSSPQHAAPCDMELGAVSLPNSLAYMRAIGAWAAGGPVPS